jgi:hypothetical protein
MQSATKAPRKNSHANLSDQSVAVLVRSWKNSMGQAFLTGRKDQATVFQGLWREAIRELNFRGLDPERNPYENPYSS